MMTGVWPDKHDVLGNEELMPGADNVPWKWFYKSVKWDEDIFKAAKRAGLTTCAIFWPVTGGHPAVDYLIDEYWPQQGDKDIREVFARAGSSAEMGELMGAVEEAGLLECTNFVLTSDHGQIEIKRILSPNVLLADAGFIELDEQGKLMDWKAYCLSGGDFAFVLETDGYTSFGKSLTRPLVRDFDEMDYRYGRATHGHLPEKGVWPVFYAKGPGFRENVI